jgi:hypothetical protein
MQSIFGQASKPTLGTAFEAIFAHQTRHPMAAHVLAQHQQLAVDLARTIHPVALKVGLANQQPQFTVA